MQQMVKFWAFCHRVLHLKYSYNSENSVVSQFTLIFPNLELRAVLPWLYPWYLRVLATGIYCLDVRLKSIDVSEEHIASFFRVKEQAWKQVENSSAQTHCQCPSVLP
jgi:hypothetical protein